MVDRDIAPGIASLARPIDELREDPRNARVHGERNIDEIRRSLRTFGQQKPIVVSPDGVVIAGNGTLAAAIAEGWSEIAAVETDLDSRAAQTAYGIADNRTAELAEWEPDVLTGLVEEIELEGLEVELTGFSAEEIAELLPEPDREIEEDEPPEPEEDSRTQRGDIIVLGGRHRVMCGDATSEEDVGALLAGGHVAAVVTDPPYGIGFEYASHDDSRESWFCLMDAVVPAMRDLAEFVVMPCCGIDRMGWWYHRHAPDWIIAWYKGSPGHRSKIGFNDWEAHLVWGKPPKQMHDYFQTECGFKGPDGHPCPKPVAWAAWLVERAASSGVVVLDPFLGSGTTLIAADQLDRTCYGLEIEPRYVDVVVRRWIAYCEKAGLEPEVEGWRGDA